MLTLSRLGSYMAKNQYGNYTSDDEFIEKWRSYPSPTALAEHLGIGVRAVMNRRRSIEIRQNITLVTDLSYKQEKSKEYIERARADKAKRQELLQ